MSDLWDEIDELLGDLNVDWQKPDEISTVDFMERGYSRYQAQRRMTELEKNGWKRGKRRRRETGRIVAVVYKP